jgi:hypothetical protein
MELPINKHIPNLIAADESPIFMDLPLRILFVRWISGLIPDVQEITVEYEFIRSLILPISRLTASSPLPAAYEKFKMCPYNSS